jgi:hypothetical protein
MLFSTGEDNFKVGSVLVVLSTGLIGAVFMQ